MVSRRAALSVLLVVGACGDDGGSAPIDGAVVDTIVPIDFDNGSCGDQLRFTGEYLDWDSHMNFCGINAAVVQVAGGGAMDSTAPNGRFDLCIPDAAMTTLEVTQPTANSQCTVPAAGYTIPTIIIANKQVIQTGAMITASAWTTTRQTSFFTDVVGVAFDPTKAQVYVNSPGGQRTLSLAANHGPAQALVVGTASTDWAAADMGNVVFFPNVDVGNGTTTLSATGGATTGTGSIPLVAGTITNVTVVPQ